MAAHLGLFFTTVVILGTQTLGLIMDGGHVSPAEFIQLQVEVESLKAKLNAVMQNINSECNLQCPQKQSVAFMAQHSAAINNPANGHVIVFDNVITNVGLAYNKIHGIFTAPVNGTYNFNLVAFCSTSQDTDHDLHLLIIKNSVMSGYILMDGHTAHLLQRTTDITLHLTEKDEVWVEVAVSSGDHILTWCHFSGFLIQAD